MTLYPFELEANLIQLIAFVVLVTWFGIRYAKKMRMPHRMFMWGMMGHIMMNIYWNTMLVIDGNGTYDFTACDASVIGSFAIWASMFQLKWKPSMRSKSGWTKGALGAFLFGVWNVAWWIRWSGHLLVNSIEGFFIIFLLYQIVYALEKEKAFRKSHKILSLIWIAILVIFQNFVYSMTGFWSVLGNWICMGAWVLFCLSICVWTWKDKKNRTVWLFALRVVVMLARLLTDGLFYSLFMVAETVVIAVLVLSFQAKEFEEVTVQ